MEAKDIKHHPEPWYAVLYPGFVSIQDGPYYEDKNLLDCKHGLEREDAFTEEQIAANAQRIVDCVNALAGIENPAEHLAHLTEQNKMLRVLVEKSVAYGMGYVCGKHNLPMRKAEIRKTASEYSKQSLSNTKPKEE